MDQPYHTPIKMVCNLWSNHDLIHDLAIREILTRYKGSLVGWMWAFFTPILLLALYTTFFSVIFKARWSQGGESKTEFAMILFVGLMVYNLFAECINRSPGLIVSNPNYVKKVIFPLETLPIISLISGVYQMIISFIAWILAYMILFGTPNITIILFPIIILPLALLILGLSWILASLGVFVRDISQLTTTAITGIMFLSPIFYPADAIPEKYRYLLYLNPLTQVIESSRNVLIWGIIPDMSMQFIYILGSSIIAWIGYLWFQFTKKNFADIL